MTNKKPKFYNSCNLSIKLSGFSAAGSPSPPNKSSTWVVESSTCERGRFGVAQTWFSILKGLTFSEATGLGKHC